MAQKRQRGKRKKEKENAATMRMLTGQCLSLTAQSMHAERWPHGSNAAWSKKKKNMRQRGSCVDEEQIALLTSVAVDIQTTHLGA